MSYISENNAYKVSRVTTIPEIGISGLLYLNTTNKTLWIYDGINGWVNSNKFSDFVYDYYAKYSDIVVGNYDNLSRNIIVLIDETDGNITNIYTSTNSTLQKVLGKSAYQVAVDNGFVGNETEWLISLVGGVMTDIGIYNASTNSATTNSGSYSLTATPPVGWLDGQAVTTTVSGSVGFSGLNFTSGSLLNIGDSLRVQGIQFVRIPFAVGDSTITPKKLEPTSFLKALTSSVTLPTETPDYRGQIGVFTDGSSNQTFFIARSLTSSIKWEKVHNDFSLNAYLTANGVLKGGTFLKTLTGSLSSIVETPDFKGQIGVYVDGTTSVETYHLARSLTSSIKWEKIHNDSSLNIYLTANINTYLSANGVLKGGTFLKTLTGTFSSINETPDFKGQLGILIVNTVEYWYAARSLGSIIKWQLLITDNIKFVTLGALTDAPAFKGQIGSFGGNQYLAIALTASASSWVLLQTDVNGLKALTSSVTLPTETPDYRGQIGVFTDGSSNQTFFIARSLTSSIKWEKVHNDFSLNAYLTANINTHLTANGVLKGSTFLKTINTDLTTVPDFKGQPGFTPSEDLFLARSTSSVDKWVKLVTDRNIKSFLSNDLLSTSTIVSQYSTEQYAHSVYSENFGDYHYVVYMANDNNNYEGATGQLIRYSKVDILDKKKYTVYEVARAGQTYGSLTLDNVPLQVPNVFKVDSDTLRIFFRATISGINSVCYRDLTISTNTLGNGFVVNCYTKGDNSTLLQMNETNVYEHYDWLRGSTDALGSTFKEVFITSDIRKLSDNNVYSCVSMGSGLDNRTTSVFMKSVNNGATWTLLASPNPLDLPGTTGTDYKFFWEASVAEDVNFFYVFGRGVNSGLASGVQLVKINKSDLYTCVGSGSSVFTKVWNTTGQKPCVFKYDNLGTFLITEGTNLPGGTLGSLRTSLDIIKISTDFTTYTKVFSLYDFDGVHTPAVSILKDTAFMTYTTSKRRKPQTRSGVDSYQNTSEVCIVELNRKYFI